MRRPWLERILDSVADRGRDLLNLSNNRDRSSGIESLCDTLLTERGEASALAIARDLIQRYQAMDSIEQQGFLDLLYRRYGPDPDTVRGAAERYVAEGDSDALRALSKAVEAPRQELLRRMNMVPDGTRVLVRMRSRLLDLVHEHPHLRMVDADMRHLLSSWFNRGFLRLERIDWQSPAEVLEKLIRYEAVHAIRGWDDLRRRLAPDRRCFAFFHPALRAEPLIFVEVALVKGIASEVGPLIDQEAPVADPRTADTAMFYSISNTQRGLRGISFGSFLLKQVVVDLGAEFDGLRTFATLSPLPRFAATIEAAAADRHPDFTRVRLDAALGEGGRSLIEQTGLDDPVQALRQLAADPGEHRERLAETLRRLAVAYLGRIPPENRGFDRVATFHLSNGARLERINPFANTSPEGLRASFGVMVNYLYDPAELEANHERFVGRGEVRMARSLGKLDQKVASVWGNS